MKILNIKHFWRKFASVFLALLLWFFIQNMNSITQQKTIPIEYTDIPNNLILVEKPEKVTYYIKIPPYYPNEIKSSLTASVSLKKISSGWHTVRIKIKHKEPLPSYASLDLSFDAVNVFLDKKSFKMVPIKVDFNQSKLSDLSLSHIKITPSIARISGPQSIVENISSIHTLPINISSKAGIHNDKASLDLPSENVAVENSSFSVQYSVKPNLEIKTLVLPISINNLPKNLSLEALSLTEISVTLSGLKSQFNDIKSDNSNLISLDLSGFSNEGTFNNIPLLINLPKGMFIIKPRFLPTVSFQIKNSPEALATEDSMDNEDSSQNNSDKNTTSSEEPTDKSDTGKEDASKKDDLNENGMVKLNDDDIILTQKKNAERIIRPLPKKMKM